MILNKFSTISSILLVLVIFACSSDKINPIEPVEVPPEVNITTPIDGDGILNKVEANAVTVKGTSTLEEGYVVTVLLSDGQNFVGGDAVVRGGKWVTESLAVSNLTNGEITITAEGTNEKGIISNTAETSLYLDQAAPVLNITGPIAGNDKIDHDEATAVVVKGTSDARNDQVVLVTFGDETAKRLTAEATVSNGHWEIKVDVSSLKSGSLMLMAEVCDLAGNPAAIQRSGVVLD